MLQELKFNFFECSKKILTAKRDSKFFRRPWAEAAVAAAVVASAAGAELAAVVAAEAVAESEAGLRSLEAAVRATAERPRRCERGTRQLGAAQDGTVDAPANKKLNSFQLNCDSCSFFRYNHTQPDYPNFNFEVVGVSLEKST